MIFVPRERSEPPSSLVHSDGVEALREAARLFFESEARPERQRQFDFDQAAIEEVEVIRSLGIVFGGKCAFCTTRLDHKSRTHRFRPPQFAVSNEGAVSRESYFWLAYEWQNLYSSCVECAVSKGSKFPIEGRLARPQADWNDLGSEKPLILDPCQDDPEQHLIYLPSGEVVSETVRGRITIEAFALNRDRLVESRREVVSRTRRAYDQAVYLLERGEYLRCAELATIGYSSSGPFAAVGRQYFNQYVQTRPRQFEDAMAASGQDLDAIVGSLERVTERRRDEAAAKFFGRELPVLDLAKQQPYRGARLRRPGTVKAPPSRSAKGQLYEIGSVAIKSVSIHNFRGIPDVHIETGATPGDGRWTVLLGENGVGKTSILQAVALALAGPDALSRSRVGIKDYLRQGAASGFVRVELEGLRDVLGFSFKGTNSLRRFSDVSVPLAGYGATRLLSGARRNMPRYSSANIENLFDPFVGLARTEHWIPELSDSDFESVARALIRLLGADAKSAFLDRSASGTLYLVGEGARVRLDSLSSGHQATASMALDMMRLFIERWGALEAAEGIVLIDEIEAHLHPRWQMRAVDALRSAFPRVQFIVSTHSPLILRGVRDGEAVVLEKTGGNIRVQDDLPALAGMTVDQILTSETFGLHSVIDPKVESKFRRYYELLALRDQTQEVLREIEALRDYLGGLRQMGDTRRERIMLQTIDEFLAGARNEDFTGSGPVSQSMRSQLAMLWSRDQS